MKWKTKDGREIEVSDMSDGHLTNTICMLLRGKAGRELARLNLFYLTSQGPNGDMASMAFDGECERLSRETPIDHLCDVGKEMLAEHQRRNLPPGQIELADKQGMAWTNAVFLGMVKDHKSTEMQKLFDSIEDDMPEQP